MIEVVHKPERMRYEVALGSEVAYLGYREREGHLEFYTTQVPPRHRGQGIAAQLVKRGLDDAKAAGKRVIPSCSYVAAYIERHPEYKSLVLD